MADDPFLNLRQIATPKGSPQPGGNLLYFKSDGKLYAKTAAGVEALVGDGASLFLAKASNLSDLTNVATARTNLGVDAAGTAASAAAAVVPAGVIHEYAGSTAPTGFLLCDGSAVSRTTYATLFAVISTTYGVGDGSTTFNVPDRRGRVGVGVDGTTEFAARNTTGGEKTHLLTAAESGLPAHGHTVGESGFSAGANNEGSTAGTTGHYIRNGAGGTLVANNNTAASAASAHNNLQPYIALNYIIKT